MDIHPRKPTVCLNMIVKNESKIIYRLFESVLPLITCYCICDTGSTDNTIDMIRAYFDAKHIEGIIVKEPFVNFEYNRNVALKSCLYLSDYVLLLDADMILEVSPDFDTSTLVSDSYLLLQGSDDFYYHNTRLIKNNGLFKYVGVTHEYIEGPTSNQGRFPKSDLFIRDIGDGCSKSDKYERDIALLQKGIQTEPNNVRYYFYLANSYHDSGNYLEAIKYYRKRVEMGGWTQEVWYSLYRIGLCYKQLNRMTEAVATWVEAYDYFPLRLENLYEIVAYYRIIRKCSLAYHYYNMAKEMLPKITDKDDYLFLHNDVYMYKFEYELSIIAGYIGIQNVNEQLVQIFNHCNDMSIVHNTLSNMKFYKDILVPIAQYVSFYDILKCIQKPEYSSIQIDVNEAQLNMDYAMLVDFKHRSDLPKLFTHISGISKGFIYGDEIWYIVHIISKEESPHYYHVFVVMNHDTKKVRYSSPFTFSADPIHYCTELIVEDHHVVIPYCTVQKKIRIAMYNKADLDQKIKYS